jgi:hypothetical protein
LAIDRGGQPSPLAAAIWFANGHNGLAGWTIPTSGWKLVAGSSSAVASGKTTLVTTGLSDRTSTVISGSQC